MGRYIIEKKGLFGTLYVDTPMYSLYQSTTSYKESAYVFRNLEQAEKVARKIRGTIVDLDDEDSQKEK